MAVRLETLEQVTEALTTWFEVRARRHPNGMRYAVLNFLPDNKSSYDYPWLTSASLFGIDNSFAWRFTRNDRRSENRSLKGRNPFVYTGIDLRNLGMAGLEGSAERKGFPVIDIHKKGGCARRRRCLGLNGRGAGHGHDKLVEVFLRQCPEELPAQKEKKVDPGPGGHAESSV